MNLAMTRRRIGPAQLSAAVALLVARFFPPAWCGRAAQRWIVGDARTQTGLADWLVEFESRDDSQRQTEPKNRFAGEWALVTHQMTALGLAQLVLQGSGSRPVECVTDPLGARRPRL